MVKKETIQSIRNEAYKEMLDFFNWLNKKLGDKKWKELMEEYNKNNFTAQSVSPKEKINVPVCQNCRELLVVEDDDNDRTDLRCPECWAKMGEESSLED